MNYPKIGNYSVCNQPQVNYSGFIGQHQFGTNLCSKQQRRCEVYNPINYSQIGYDYIFNQPHSSANSFNYQSKIKKNTLVSFPQVVDNSFNFQSQISANTFVNQLQVDDQNNFNNPQIEINTINTQPEIGNVGGYTQSKIAENTFLSQQRTTEKFYDAQQQNINLSNVQIKNNSNSFANQPQIEINDSLDQSQNGNSFKILNHQVGFNNSFTKSRNFNTSYANKMQLFLNSIVYPNQKDEETVVHQQQIEVGGQINNQITDDISEVHSSCTNGSNFTNEVSVNNSVIDSVSENTEFKYNENLIFGNKSFDITALNKYFKKSSDKLSILTNNIDKEISFHLSNDKIQDCFIYSIFFDTNLKLKEEFLFLIFVLPEIEVITQVYNQIQIKLYDINIFDNYIQAFKQATKSLIIFYRDSLDSIIKLNAFKKYTTIPDIIEYFLCEMKTSAKNFRLSNLTILTPCFSECKSFKLYKDLIQNNLNASRASKLYSIVSIMFFTFLHQDWLNTLSCDLPKFENFKFRSIIHSPYDVIKTKSQAISCLKNLNVFINLIN